MLSERSTRSAGVALEVQGLGKWYRIGSTEGLYRYRSLREDLTRGLRRRVLRTTEDERTLWALRDVSFHVHEGETVGVIGHNGAGKSTLFKLLARITPPSEGRAVVRGRLGSLLEVGTGFHPELSGRENIFLAGAVLGMRRVEIAAKLDDIVEFADIAQFLETPVKRFSSGMYTRLAFAVAAHLDPEVLLVDEVLSVGDAQFQKKCLGKISDIGTSGRTVLFVSHNMQAVLRICDRVILLRGGRVVADGAPAEVIRQYLDAGTGTAAERSWQDPADAPGDDLLRLKSVRVRSRDVVSEEVPIDQPVEVEVQYWQLRDTDDLRPTVALHLINEDGITLFSTNDFNDRRWAQAERRAGIVTATCTIPANFLAEGGHFVLVGLCTYNPPVVHALERDVAYFHVVDRTTGEGVRGECPNEWFGVVRPMLDWRISREAAPVSGGQSDAAADYELSGAAPGPRAAGR